MKCPYLIKIIHKFNKNITEFGECLKSECPCYYTTLEHEENVEHCRRIESIESKE